MWLIICCWLIVWNSYWAGGPIHQSVQFSSVAQSCPTLCDPMNRSTPGLPVHHQLPEFTQTHVRRVSDAIQPSHPLSSPSPPASNPSQYQSFPMSQLFTWGGQSTGVSALASFRPKWMQFQKQQKDICSFPRQTIQYHNNPILCPNQQCWRSRIWKFLWRPSRTNTKKRCPFHYRGLECKSRKSRNTWTNGKIWPCSTVWSRAKSNRVLPRKCIGHSKHFLPAIQEKTLHMDITRWSTPKSDWLYSLQSKMDKLYTVGKNKTRSWLWLRSWTPYCSV